MIVEVAKVLGWRRERREEHHYPESRSVVVWDEWVDADGNDVGAYTADDLLSWLTERVGAVTVVFDHDDAPGDRVWVLWSRSDDKDGDEAFGPTLLEALERAVLAVAAGEVSQ